MSRNEKVEESDAETHGRFRNDYVALCQIIHVLRNNRNTRKNTRRLNIQVRKLHT